LATLDVHCSKSGEVDIAGGFDKAPRGEDLGGAGELEGLYRTYGRFVIDAVNCETRVLVLVKEDLDVLDGFA